MAWVYLIVAGLLETGWAVGLKYTDGFTKLVPSVLTLIGIAASMFLLGLAARTIPIGTAYSIWVGIGAVGAVLLGIVLFDEPRDFARMFFCGPAGGIAGGTQAHDESLIAGKRQY
jgi:quaternary ammonium compound-resistance protein SugE